MAKYYSLPSCYLGSAKEGRNLYERVYESYAANQSRFDSQNLFIRHLITYALSHDRSLKKAS
jgi:hypothetical protein